MYPMNGVGFMGRKNGDAGLPFIFTVTVGSGQSFQLPTVSPVAGGVYDAFIEWGDTTSNTLTVYNAAVRTHTYTTGGTYEIRISGVFTGWQVNFYADRLKISEIKQWGILKITAGFAFRGCNNVTISATDYPDTISCTTFERMFEGCASITSFPNLGSWDVSNVTTLFLCFNNCTNLNADINAWDVSNVVNMRGCFAACVNFNSNLSSWNVTNCVNFLQTFFGCTLFNSDISSWVIKSTGTVTMSNMFRTCDSFNQNIGLWNMAAVTSFERMFQQATAFNQNLGSWVVTNVDSFSNMFLSKSLSTANYDALLIGWASQTVKTGKNFHAGTSKYTNSGPALAARNTLISTYGWTITDGGPA